MLRRNGVIVGKPNRVKGIGYQGYAVNVTGYEENREKKIKTREEKGGETQRGGICLFVLEKMKFMCSRGNEKGDERLNVKAGTH